MERKILCPRCRRLRAAEVRFPAFRPTYLHEGEVVFRVLCDSCRELSRSARPGVAQSESSASASPDLPSQLEDLFNEVWRCEADWRLLDRLDLMDRRYSVRHRST